jgi:hypothetical protein
VRGTPRAIRWLAALALAGLAAASRGAEELAVEVITLEHQSAAAAVELVHPLLTASGTVELRPEANTLVVRDTAAAAARIGRLLADFDHPPRRLGLTVQLVEATVEPAAGAPATAAGGRGLEAEVVRRLRSLLRFQRFTMLGQADLETAEREAVSYRLGDRYRVAFRVGTLLGGSLKLAGFQVERERAPAADRVLLATDLAVAESQPLVLGLARTEESDRALMIVLTLRRLPEARLAGPAPEQ